MPAGRANSILRRIRDRRQRNVLRWPAQSTTQTRGPRALQTCERSSWRLSDRVNSELPNMCTVCADCNGSASRGGTCGTTSQGNSLTLSARHERIDRGRGPIPVRCLLGNFDGQSVSWRCRSNAVDRRGARTWVNPPDPATVDALCIGCYKVVLPLGHGAERPAVACPSGGGQRCGESSGQRQLNSPMDLPRGRSSVGRAMDF